MILLAGQLSGQIIELRDLVQLPFLESDGFSVEIRIEQRAVGVFGQVSRIQMCVTQGHLEGRPAPELLEDMMRRTFAWAICACLVSAAGATGDENMTRLRVVQLAQLLTTVLQDNGFVRRRRNWYRYEDESILLVNLQSSQYGPRAYINLGVYYRRYGALNTPAVTQCHILTRLSRLVGVPGAMREAELLDLGNDISDETRGDELREMIRAFGIPWLEGLAQFSAARSSFLNANATYVAPEARADLGLGSDSR